MNLKALFAKSITESWLCLKSLQSAILWQPHLCYGHSAPAKITCYCSASSFTVERSRIKETITAQKKRDLSNWKLILCLVRDLFCVYPITQLLFLCELSKFILLRSEAGLKKPKPCKWRRFLVIIRPNCFARACSTSSRVIHSLTKSGLSS